MNQQTHLLQRKFGLLGAICGGLLIGFPTVSLASPVVSRVLNPCPGIYYEEPYNSTRLVPEGCRPNAATRLLSEQAQLSRQQMVRQDDGLLKVMSMPTSQNGMLAVSLDEATRLSDNQGVLRIQPDGQVFLN